MYLAMVGYLRMRMQEEKIDGGVVDVVSDGVDYCLNTCACGYSVGVGMMKFGFVCC